jgi:hypothetical protein
MIHRIAIFSLALSVTALQGQLVLLDEFESGLSDLISSDPAAPTPIDVSVGTSRIVGQVSASVGDIRDYISFTIDAGEQLTGLFLIEYDDPDLPGSTEDGNLGYIHIDDGLTSVIPDAGTITDFLGGNHLGRSIYPDASANILSDIATAPAGGTGFTAPLGPGDYVINIQQTGPQLTNYTLDIVVIPEPSVAALMAGIFALALTVRRRR